MDVRDTYRSFEESKRRGVKKKNNKKRDVWINREKSGVRERQNKEKTMFRCASIRICRNANFLVV